MIESAPLPEMSEGVEAPFWTGLKNGQLMVQRCAPCNAWMFPTRVRCATCGAAPLWQPVSGRGRIWSFTRVHPPVLPAFSLFTPYPVVVVELDEQPDIRMIGNLIDRASDPIDAIKGDIVIGAPVEVVIRDLGGTPWPGWRIVSHRL